MLEVSCVAAQVLAQLNITVQSYQSLMEKLEVDISLVEKEKARIAEILEDYLKDVHENLGKIDHNSTITVRERPIKMLRLELPSWEENLTVYQLRINDFLNEITRQGIDGLSATKMPRNILAPSSQRNISMIRLPYWKCTDSSLQDRGAEGVSHHLGRCGQKLGRGGLFVLPLSSFPACSAICGGMIQISSQTEMKERFSSWIIHLPRPTRSIF